MKKIIILSLVLILIGVGIFKYLKRDSAGKADLYLSDVIATNIGFIEPSSQDKLRFFTGNNIAQLDLKSPQKTTSLSPVVPMGRVLKVVWLQDAALVKVNQLEDTEYLYNSMSEADQSIYSSYSSWWYVDKTAVRKFEFPDIISAYIQDIFIESGKIHILYGKPSGNVFSVAVYSSVAAKSPEYKMEDKFDLSQIVGADSNSTIIMESNGGLRKVTKNSYDSLGKDKYISAKWDPITKNLVVARANKELKSSSNDQDKHENESGFKLAILNLENGKTKEIQDSATGIYFISGGKIYNFSSDKDKSLLEYDLKSNKSNKYSLMGGKYSNSSIRGLAVNSNLISVTDNQNNLSVFSQDSNLVAGLPETKLIKTNEREINLDNMYISYDLTQNKASIVVYEPVEKAPETISKYLPEVEKIIGDANQVNIEWSFETESEF